MLLLFFGVKLNHVQPLAQIQLLLVIHVKCALSTDESAPNSPTCMACGVTRQRRQLRRHVCLYEIERADSAVCVAWRGVYTVVPMGY